MKTLSLALTLAATVLFTGCGSDSSENNSPAANNETSIVSTPSQGSAKTTLAATSPILIDRSIISAINSTQSLSAVTNSKTREVITSSNDCYAGGTMDVVLESTSAAVINYNDCDMGEGAIQNGSVNLTDMVLSGSDISSATMKLHITTTSDTVESMTNITMAFVSNGAEDYTSTINGTIDTTESINSTHTQYTNYKITSTTSTIAIDGTITINNTPEVCGGNGSYTIETVSPMNISDYETITSGEININDYNYVFHSDNTVTITADTSSETFDQSELTTCNSDSEDIIEDIEDDGNGTNINTPIMEDDVSSTNINTQVLNSTDALIR